ncbi:hypothetical protein NUH16_003091 [Penicillium rubens]|nr:hypothetical protein NUH16_003091 [Penicillium rubens]
MIKTGTVTILDLRPRSGLSDSVVFAPLQTLILKQLGIVQAEQMSACRRFSAIHLCAFWNAHIQSHNRLLDAPPFDLLARARRDYTRNDTVGECLREVNQYKTSVDCSKEGFDDFVATAFLMDAYPPGMHGFSPTPMFAALYEKLCLGIWDEKFQSHIAGVSSRFVQHFVQLSSVMTSAAVRKETLHRLYRRWGGLRSTTTCLVCLCRPPEHMLPCKSRLCRICALELVPVPRCIQWLASAFNLTTDGLYDSDGLSQIFKAAVGPSRRMFDVATASPAGCRIAIVASRTFDGKACVLANYRGTRSRTTNTAYQFLAPRNGGENPALCDAAICSVAAPFYFQPKRLPGLGLLQDGGVRANNPLAIALRESGIIWPMAKRHDLLQSVGTGFSTSTPSESTGFLGRILEGALPRLYRATMSSPSMDGKQGFLEALNYLPHMSTPDMLRLGQAIYGTLPELDDCQLSL